MIYVTADLHFQHEKILEYQSNRKFSDIYHMDGWIIHEWNQIATDKDIIYILGDISFRGDPKITANYLSRLNGHINIIPGNHDYNISKVLDIYKGARVLKKHYKDPFTILSALTKIKYKKYNFIMCHYPLESWEGQIRSFEKKVNQKQSSIHLHGHQHGRNNTKAFRMDIGLDATNNVLISLDEILTTLCI